MLISKGARKALERSKKEDFMGSLANYDLDWERLKVIGKHKSFEWSRPGHTEPRGKIRVAEIRQELEQQLKRRRRKKDELPASSDESKRPQPVPTR